MRAVQTSPPDFVDSFRRHLVLEQRRAVLEVLAADLDPEITIGEVIEAAEDLGWIDGIGDLCLAELAEALIADAGGSIPAAGSIAAPGPIAAAEVEVDDEDEGDEEDEDEGDEDEVAVADDEEEEEEEPPPAPARAIPKAKMGAKKAARAKKAAKAAPAKKASKATAKASKRAAAAIPAAKKSSKKAAKAPSRASASRKAAPVDDGGDEAMSMEQAAKALLPIVRKLKEATMQDLEEKTGMGRRKLRFHIGQLVKHGRLRRHGMGRGTYYTVVK